MAKLDRQDTKTADLLENFIRYIHSPWRLMWMNFVAGIFRGLGAVIGLAIVIATTVYLLSLFAMLPVLGEYARQLQQTVVEYANDTNYNDEFVRLEQQLKNINQNIVDIEVIELDDEFDE